MMCYLVKHLRNFAFAFLVNEVKWLELDHATTAGYLIYFKQLLLKWAFAWKSIGHISVLFLQASRWYEKAGN
jgi:hypothetical protein